MSSSTRAALADTRLVEVVPAGPSRLHSSAPPRSDEPPVVLHPRWAPAHPRRGDGSDARTPLRRTHVLHPGVAPRRGPRPGRRPRPIVPFDIPIEAFAVEVGGGAHPSIRSLGTRRLVYVEHRQTLRRAYRRRQLVLAMGMAGAFVAVAAAALAPGGADAAPSLDARAEGLASKVAAPALPPAAANPVPQALSAPPNPLSRRRWAPDAAVPAATGRTLQAVVFRRPVDRDEARLPPPYVPGYHGQPLSREPFLECTRRYESKYAGGYQAVSRGGQYRGAYQFDRKTWDETARHVQRFDLVGVDPAAAPPVAQDLLASRLYQWQGAEPWAFRCAGLP